MIPLNCVDRSALAVPLCPEDDALGVRDAMRRLARTQREVHVYVDTQARVWGFGVCQIEAVRSQAPGTSCPLDVAARYWLIGLATQFEPDTHEPTGKSRPDFVRRLKVDMLFILHVGDVHWECRRVFLLLIAVSAHPAEFKWVMLAWETQSKHSSSARYRLLLSAPNAFHFMDKLSVKLLEFIVATGTFKRGAVRATFHVANIDCTTVENFIILGPILKPGDRRSPYCNPRRT